MICSPLLAKQYFLRQQKFLGTPLQVNQQAYAKQAKKCRSVIKILVTSSACLQFLGFRSHDGGHFAILHTAPFLLLFSFWLGHACIVGRIQPISLCKSRVMSVRGPNNVGRAVQTDPTLLRYASAITEQKKCWELLAEKFDRFQTLRNNMQHGVQTDATCNIQQCWELLHTNAASVCMQPYCLEQKTESRNKSDVSIHQSEAK